MTKETALKILRELHNKALFSERTALETFIPELAETEDERIRKFITHELACLRASEEKDSDRYKELTTAISWLEKQREKNPVISDDALREGIAHFGITQYQIDNWLKKYIDVEKQGEQKETNLVEILKHYPRETELYSPLYGKLWLAEADEKHETITCYKHRLDEGCTRAILEQEDTVSFYSNGTTGLPDCTISKDCMLFIYDIEAQSEKNPNPYSGTSFEYNGHVFGMCARDGGVEILIDSELKAFVSEDLGETRIYPSIQNKTESKFKAGDWVVYETEEWWEVLMVYRADDGIYHLVDVNGEPSNALFEEECNMRLWSIGDAKPGDVIYLPNGNNEYYFFIFKGIENAAVTSFAHFYQYNDGTSKVEGSTDKLSSVNDIFQPATKEQRDLLFQKMKEAGYEWDSEKKELKKIEQKPFESDWADLGLPSGTLWKSSNESEEDDDFYTYDEAVQKFGNQLPQKEQWEELIDRCRWTWADNGYNVTGPNGNSIFLPASGYSYCRDGKVYDVGSYGEYWSSEPRNSIYAYSCEFNWSEIGVYGINRCYGMPVRLVNSTLQK